MALGRTIYRTLLQITKQYELKRLPLTGVVGFTEARFRSPPAIFFREALDVRQHQPDYDGNSSRIDHPQSDLCERGCVKSFGKL